MAAAILYNICDLSRKKNKHYGYLFERLKTVPLPFAIRS